MPKLEAKQVQKELDEGWLWPVYWIYGPEGMKARELLKRIRVAVLGAEAAEAPAATGGGLFGLSEEKLDAGEVDGAGVVDIAQSLAFGGGTRLVIVRDAHALKGSEALEALFGKRAKKEELASVCVLLAKDLDGRKKFSKTLVEHAAVIACEEVPEADREAWVNYLAKRRGLALSPAQIAGLVTLDPWTLDIADQELEKLSLIGSDAEGDDAGTALGASVSGASASDRFLDAFFRRSAADALPFAARLADHPDEALPLLGLLAWNTRQLSIVVADREKATRHAKLNPYVAGRLQGWARGWTLADCLSLQEELARLDFSFKQTPLPPLGLWAELIGRFAR